MAIMATEIAQELAAVIAARLKAAEGPDEVKQLLCQARKALYLLARTVGKNSKTLREK